MKKFYIAVVAISFFVIGCSQIDKAPISNTGDIIEISHGTVASFGELRIGLGNINKTEYTNDLGKRKHGLLANLFLFIDGNPPIEKSLEVYAGQNVQVGKYSVYVQEIQGGLKGLVKLQIKKEQ
jgi:hypothetical protein